MAKFIKWNFKKFIEDYLHPLFRTPIRMKWLETMCSQIEYNYDELIVRRDMELFLMQHTGQVLSLEHLLNSLIDVTGKPIIISDSENIPNHYVGTDGEALPNITDEYTLYNSTVVNYNPAKVYLKSDDELTVVEDEYEVYVIDDVTAGTDVVDFYVFVDYIDGIDTEKKQLINMYVNKYKLAGSTFRIIKY